MKHGKDGARTPKEILEALSERIDNVDNLLVVFSEKRDEAGDETIAIGMSEASSTTWFMSALEWTRWHIFDTLSAMRQTQELTSALRASVEAQERELLADLEDEGLDEHLLAYVRGKDAEVH